MDASLPPPPFSVKLVAYTSSLDRLLTHGGSTLTSSSLIFSYSMARFAHQKCCTEDPRLVGRDSWLLMTQSAYRFTKIGRHCMISKARAEILIGTTKAQISA